MPTMTPHSEHWSTDGSGQRVNYSDTGLLTGALDRSGACPDCVAEVSRIGQANLAAATPADLAWADQLAAEAREDNRRTTIRESARLEAEGVGQYTSAEVMVARENLGLTRAALANLLGVSERAVARWEDGERVISDRMVAALDALTNLATREVMQAVEELRAAPTDARTIFVYRSDTDLQQAHPGTDHTAGWTRAIARRVCEHADFHVTVEFV